MKRYGVSLALKPYTLFCRCQQRRFIRSPPKLLFLKRSTGCLSCTSTHASDSTPLPARRNSTPTPTSTHLFVDTSAATLPLSESVSSEAIAGRCRFATKVPLDDGIRKPNKSLVTTIELLLASSILPRAEYSLPPSMTVSVPPAPATPKTAKTPKGVPGPSPMLLRSTRSDPQPDRKESEPRGKHRCVVRCELFCFCLLTAERSFLTASPTRRPRRMSALPSLALKVGKSRSCMVPSTGHSLGSVTRSSE